MTRIVYKSLEEAFKQQGNFIVTKTNGVFSAIGFDQAHEQNNKSVKVDRGATGTMHNKSALSGHNLDRV